METGAGPINARRFNALIEVHLETIYRAAFRLVRNRADAEDLVQETCVRAIQRLADLDETRSVTAWMLTVMHNVFVDHARRIKRSPVTSQPDGNFVATACPNPNPEEHAAMAEREDRLHAAWSKLEPGDRVVLALRAEEYAATEIAEITGIPIDALYARLYRARRKLARHLNDNTPTEHRYRMEIAK